MTSTRKTADPLALAVAILCLGVAIPAIIGDTDWLPDHALRWFVVGAAVLAGIASIAGTLWDNRRHD